MIFYVKVVLDSFKEYFYCPYINLFYHMYLFIVLGFFAAFFAFMKIGSNDFGITSGKAQSKDQQTS